MVLMPKRRTREVLVNGPNRPALQEGLRVNYVKITCLSFLVVSSAMATPPGVPPGPPAVEIAGTVDANVVNTVDANVVNTVDANVVNTVETNVANTVDANVVNTLPAGLLEGIDLAPSAVNNATVFFFDPVSVHAISTSIAPEIPGEICNVSVGIKSDSTADLEPIGLSVMSNGQAANVARNYDIPLESLVEVNFDISGNATTCRLSLSVSFISLAPPAAAAASERRSLAGQERARIEIR